MVTTTNRLRAKSTTRSTSSKLASEDKFLLVSKFNSVTSAYEPVQRKIEFTTQ
ncbi:hypothetical protein HOLleu_00672 [Holothuria leucospilota]|uniref:Uncharacterized protein n=1 Tax=Holothuria leucospilota TaxID=206669 RepID=A0A9Q1CPB3_HOLLE|nr:hypothetical protein HOLleu_00672 [Holothuria leucospilota]